MYFVRLSTYNIFAERRPFFNIRIRHVREKRYARRVLSAITTMPRLKDTFESISELIFRAKDGVSGYG